MPWAQFVRHRELFVVVFLCIFVSKVTNGYHIVLYAGLLCIYIPSNHIDASSMPQAFPYDSRKGWIQNIVLPYLLDRQLQAANKHNSLSQQGSFKDWRGQFLIV